MLVTALCLPGLATAQEAPPTPAVEEKKEPIEEKKEAIERSAMYLGLGLGAGASTLAEQSLGDTPFAATLGVRLGGAINDQLLVGGHIVLVGQFFAWEEEENTGAMVSAILLETMYFPVADLPLNIAAGAGWASAAKLRRLTDDRDGDASVAASTGDGVGWMGGVGWDFAPGTGANLGLQARYDGSQSADLGVSHGGGLHLWLNFY